MRIITGIISVKKKEKHEDLYINRKRTKNQMYVIITCMFNDAFFQLSSLEFRYRKSNLRVWTLERKIIKKYTSEDSTFVNNISPFSDMFHTYNCYYFPKTTTIVHPHFLIRWPDNSDPKLVIRWEDLLWVVRLFNKWGRT